MKSCPNCNKFSKEVYIIHTIYQLLKRNDIIITRSQFPFLQSIPYRGGGAACTPYNGLYEEARPERGTIFRLQVYERVGNSVILACKKEETG